jgi:hypothetical protein
MKKIIYIIISYITMIQVSFAEDKWYWWILWNFKGDDTEKALRTWDIHLWDIPIMIRNAIDFFITIAWTVAIIFIIIWAYKILFWSLEQDKTKWKDTIIMAIWWFALASLAWFIIKLIIDNLS